MPSARPSKTSSREIAADKFFQTPKSENERETVLKPNEIITAISVPLSGAENATYEIRHRQGLDWPYVTASVAKTNGGTKVVLGHVAPTPWIVAGNDAAQGAKPLSGNGYKVKMVKTAVKRALAAASKRSQQLTEDCHEKSRDSNRDRTQAAQPAVQIPPQ